MKAIVIVAEGFHAGYLGCFGNDWIDTPALDRLAAEGVVFDQHYSDRPDAASARRAWRTGCYSFPLPGGGETTVAEESPDLLCRLREAGVSTFLVRDGRLPTLPDVAVGWEHHVLVTPAGKRQPLDRTLAAVEKILDRLLSMPHWLLWIELSTMLPPWNVPTKLRDRYVVHDEETDEGKPLLPETDPPMGPLNDDPDDTKFLRIQQGYATACTYLDSGIGRLCEALASRNLSDECLLVFTTDRGAALGEHGVVGDCRPWLHDELIHLPLIVRLPGAAEAGRRVSALTQPVDLMPTLLDFFQLPAAPVHGHSLAPFWRGAVEQVRSHACCGLRIGPALEWAMRTPEWSFLLPLELDPTEPQRIPQLYVKPEDRWEVNNLLQHNQDLAEQLERVLRGFVEATCLPGPWGDFISPLPLGERGRG